MSAAKGSVAKLQSFLQNLPEALHIAIGGAGYIHQVDGDNPLIETSIILMAAVCIALAVLHGQEGAASHAGIYIALL